MYHGNRALTARVALRYADHPRVGHRSLMPAAGMLTVGTAMIVAGGLIGAMVASPVAPSLEQLAVIRLVGVGVFSVGIALLPVPDASLRRGLLAYGALATLYLCSLMLAAMLIGETWPAGWIVAAAVLHGLAFAAIVLDWLRHPSAERLKAIRRPWTPGT